MTQDKDDYPETLLLRGGRVVLADSVEEGGEVLVEAGRIARVGPRVGGGGNATGVLDLDGLTVYPGFVDVHIHGAVGVDTLEASAADLGRVAGFLAGRGVTAWLPRPVPPPAASHPP